MKKLILLRQPSTEHGTRGELFTEDKMLHCFTIERPWLDNDPIRHSCIPPGVYRCRRGGPGEFPTHPGAFEITNVPGRTAILFHVGNTIQDVIGCVAVGNMWGTLKGNKDKYEGDKLGGIDLPAVLQSKPAYARFMAFLEGEDEFELEVI